MGQKTAHYSMKFQLTVKSRSFGLSCLKRPCFCLPYADPERQKAAVRRWYEQNRELTIQRTKSRQKANWQAHLAYKREYRRKNGRKDRPFISDPEKLHRSKAVQRWLGNPKLSPSVADLIIHAEQLFKEREERRQIHLLYNREKSKRRKAQIRALSVSKVSAKDLRHRYAEFGDCCAYCGDKQKIDELHMDHFLPLSKGGTHVLSNLVPACKRCNLSKRNHHPEDWFKRQDFFSLKRWRMILRILGKKNKTVDQLAFW